MAVGAERCSRCDALLILQAPPPPPNIAILRDPRHLAWRPLPDLNMDELPLVAVLAG